VDAPSQTETIERAGHFDIGKNDIHASVRFKDLQSLLGIARFKDRETRIRQEKHSQHADQGLVFDD
jgi:hypothetical protein